MIECIPRLQRAKHPTSITSEPEELHQGQSWPSTSFQKLSERQFYLLMFLMGIFTSSNFFVEMLRIAETELAFFGGNFCSCRIGCSFLNLGLRLTLGRNNIVSEGGQRGLYSFSSHIFLALVEKRHLGTGRRRMSPACCHWERQYQASGYRKNGCDDSLLLSLCWGFLGSSSTAVSCTHVLPGPLALF